MERIELVHWWAVLAVAPLLLSVAGCASRKGDSLEDLAGRIPGTVAGWHAVGDELYDPETIYDYIDGHAEVYLAYGMEACLARRYSGPEGEPDIVLDVFRLPASGAAFGVFTHEPDGEPIELGQGGLEQAGWLRFWKGRYFVSLYPEGESPRAESAAEELARGVADAITETGPRPRLVGALPDRGRDPGSVRWVLSPEVLTSVLRLGGENPYDVGPRSPAALARYTRDDASATLVVVEYPDEAGCARAAERLVSLRGARQADGVPRAADDGSWWAAAARGRDLLVVTAADAPSLAGELLEEMADALGENGE